MTFFFIKTQKPSFFKGGFFLHLQFHDHRQDHGIALGGLIEVTTEVIFNSGLDGGPITDMLALAALDGTLILAYLVFFFCKS